MASKIRKVKTTQSLKHKESFVNNARKRYQLWLMVIPAVLILIIFNYIPMYGIQLAFREYNFSKGITGGAFVGLKYFEKFVNSFQFSNIMLNTFKICIFSVIVGFPIPIFLALILNQIKAKKTKKFIQTTIYAPHFISTVVMVGMLNVILSPNTGIIGRLFVSLGFSDLNLLGSSGTFVPVFVLSDIWQHAGWNSIIFLAALSSVDTELYDACKVDGASKWATIWNIEIPCLIPTIIILLILNMGNILNVGFEKAFLMQNDLNIGSSEVISTYVYKIGIRSHQFSYSAAIGLFNTLVNFIMLVTVNRISKKHSDTSLW